MLIHLDYGIVGIYAHMVVILFNISILSGLQLVIYLLKSSGCNTDTTEGIADIDHGIIPIADSVFEILVQLLAR